MTQTADASKLYRPTSSAPRFVSDTAAAEAGGVSLSTVRDFEKGRRVPIGNNMNALRAAIESKGIVFTENGITGPIS